MSNATHTHTRLGAGASQHTAGRVNPERYDPFSAAFKHHAEVEAAAELEILQPIHSVGAVNRAYKQRQREEEAALQKRHAAKIVKIVKNVNNASSTGLSGQAGQHGGAGRGVGSKGGNNGGKQGPLRRMVEGLGYGASTISSLGHDESLMLGGGLDQDNDEWAAPHLLQQQQQEEPAVIIDGLDYSVYSCDDLAKNEILARVRRCLTAGTTVVLRTVSGGDTLDGKMLLKTISNHHCNYTENGYIVPPIYHSADSLCLEMQLQPKKMF